MLESQCLCQYDQIEKNTLSESSKVIYDTTIYFNKNIAYKSIEYIFNSTNNHIYFVNIKISMNDIFN